MSTIDEVLERAAADTRTYLRSASRAPVSVVRRRARRRTGLNVAAGALGACGALISVWLVPTRAGDRAPGSPPAVGSTGPGDDRPGAVDLDAIPRLGIDWPRWQVVDAGETDEPGNGPARWISYVHTSSDGEARLGAFLNLFAVPVGSLAEQSLMPRFLELERIRVADRDVGRYSNELRNGFTFAWRESDTVVATLTVFGGEGSDHLVTRAEAIQVIRMIQPLGPADSRVGTGSEASAVSTTAN